MLLSGVRDLRHCGSHGGERVVLESREGVRSAIQTTAHSGVREEQTNSHSKHRSGPRCLLRSSDSSCLIVLLLCFKVLKALLGYLETKVRLRVSAFWSSILNCIC